MFSIPFKQRYVKTILSPLTPATSCGFSDPLQDRGSGVLCPPVPSTGCPTFSWLLGCMWRVCVCVCACVCSYKDRRTAYNGRYRRRSMWSSDIKSWEGFYGSPLKNQGQLLCKRRRRCILEQMCCQLLTPWRPLGWQTERVRAGASRSGGPGVKAWLSRHLGALKKITLSKPWFSYLLKEDNNTP